MIILHILKKSKMQLILSFNKSPKSIWGYLGYGVKQNRGNGNIPKCTQNSYSNLKKPRGVILYTQTPPYSEDLRYRLYTTQKRHI